MTSAIEFERTRDWRLIKRVLTHPRVYPYIGDDYAPPPEQFEPLAHDSIWYVAVKDGDELLGVFIFMQENPICWKVHTCLLPNAYGARALAAGSGVVDWIFETTRCLRIVTDVPEYNHLALRFARRVGLQEYGRNPQSYLKGGKLQEQIMLGITKGGEACR